MFRSTHNKRKLDHIIALMELLQSDMDDLKIDSQRFFVREHESSLILRNCIEELSRKKDSETRIILSELEKSLIKIELTIGEGRDFRVLENSIAQLEERMKNHELKINQ